MLHGLWPQYQHGYPSFCSTQKLPVVVKDKFPGLYPSEELYNHEWEKHGTCTGLEPEDYLSLSKHLKEVIQIPVAYQSPEKPFRVNADQLKSDFVNANSGFKAGDFAVFCSNNRRYLKEIYVCFDFNQKTTACSAEINRNSSKSCQSANFLVRNIR